MRFSVNQAGHQDKEMKGTEYAYLPLQHLVVEFVSSRAP